MYDLMQQAFLNEQRERLRIFPKYTKWKNREINSRQIILNLQNNIAKDGIPNCFLEAVILQIFWIELWYKSASPQLITDFCVTIVIDFKSPDF